MTSEIILNPIGLVTQPNTFGRFPNGALKTAYGMVIRDPGILRTHGGFSTFHSAPWSSGAASACHIIPSTPDRPYSLVLFYDQNAGVWKSSWINSSGAAVVASSTMTIPCYSIIYGGTSSTETASNPEVFAYSHTINRDRVILAMRDSVMVCDAPNGTVPSAPRLAGLRPPRVVFGTSNWGAGTAVASDRHINLVAVHRRVYPDGYTLVSAPSAAQGIDTSYSPAGTSTDIMCDVNPSLPRMLVGDKIDVYRTFSQPTTPGYTNVGAEYRLCATYTVTDPNITQTFYATTPDESLGEALYTNTGQKGASGANAQPWPSKCVATFKGYTFYGAVTSPPVANLKAAALWGNVDQYTGPSDALRSAAFGTRTVAGTATLGSPIISGVSASGMKGIVVGQSYSGPFSAFPSAAKVVSVGASSFTLDTNAAATVSAYPYNVLYDLIESSAIGGTRNVVNASAFSAYMKDTNLIVQCLELVSPPSSYGTLSSGRDVQPADVMQLTYPFLANLPELKFFTLRATNGHNLIPALPSIELGETATTFSTSYRGNLLKWSEEQQPEHVPTANQAFIGHGEIIAMVPTRDALWIFCTDGLWRLSGTGGGAGSPGFDWRLDPVDPNLILQSRRAYCTLRDVIYALTNRGFVSIDSSGLIKDISQGRIGDFLPGKPFSDAYTSTWLCADEENDEVIISDPTVTRLTDAPLIYNALTDTFTQMKSVNGADGTLQGQTWLHGAYARGIQKVLLVPSANGSIYYVDEVGSVQVPDFQFQPTYGDDPFVLRRWQRVYFAWSMLDQNASPSRLQVWVNGVSASAGGYVDVPSYASSSREERAASRPRESFAVPRNAPAVSNCISVGAYPYWSAMPPFAVYGISIESISFTRQRKTRNQ